MFSFTRTFSIRNSYSMLRRVKLYLILALCFLLVGCQSEERPPISEVNTSCSNGVLTVYAIGQWTGFTTSGKDINVYPYYDEDRYVSVRPFYTSANNFWYDFVSAKGKTMKDIKIFKSGVMLLDINGEVFGYKVATDDTALFAHTVNLPSGYVKLALEHATVNN